MSQQAIARVEFSRGVTLDGSCLSISIPKEQAHSMEVAFDCAQTIEELESAIECLREGNGGQATKLEGEAFVKLALFHRY